MTPKQHRQEPTGVQPSLTDALLVQVLDELKAIRAAVERRSRPRNQDDVRVLVAVVRVFGDQRFSTGDVIDYSRIGSSQQLQVNALREALAAGDCDSRRALGISSDGLRVRRLTA